MSKPWHKASPAFFEQIKRDVQSEYQNLNFYEERGIIFIRGSFPILYKGKILERYLIEIEFKPDYPESLPIVREIGGQIPRTLDFHINPTSGDACLFVPDERWWVFPPGSTFQSFLNGPVRNFFLSQALVSLGQPWPFGQRPHGAAGILEFYKELLKTDDIDTIIRYLEYIMKPKIKGHWDCPCGNGKRLRICHRDQVQDLSSKIPPNVARKSLAHLLSIKTNSVLWSRLLDEHVKS
jgi:hypothetical protein